MHFFIYLLEWNHAIKPKYGMVDCDAAEIFRMGVVFLEVKISYVKFTETFME